MDKIMVVDDEPDIVNLVKKVLERAGYWVSSAPNGDQALEVVDAEAPDLILLDLVMPGKSGLEVCKILKSQPKTKNIPIVMFTALGRDVDRKLSEWAGADAHFTKPFKRTQLLAELKAWLDDSKSSKFSRQLGINHSKLRGKKVLVEFDPRTDYQRCISDFAVESVFHDETTVVITRKETPIRKALERFPNVAVKDLEVTLMLSAILKQYTERPLSLVFDSVTSLVLGNFTEKLGVTMYRFAENFLQILSQPTTTALFLLNPSAHEPRDVSSLRGIFANQVAYSKEGLTVVKLEP